MRVCDVDGCEERHAARGYCRAHYDKAKQKGEFKKLRPKGRKGCEAEGCTGDHYSLGYCQLHWARLNRTGSLELVLRPAFSKCEVNGCEEDNVAKGLCRYHYDFYRRTGYDLREEIELLEHLLALEAYGLTVRRGAGSLLHN